MKITTDLTGSETASVRQARLKAVYDWYKGAGAYVAAGNLGVVRAALNEYLTSDIANKETFASWLVKFNQLNDPDVNLPLTLFANGEQGVWLDPSNLANLFQDAAGTTPVTSTGQPVGLILDKSGRGNFASQATSSKRPSYMIDGSGLYYLGFDGIDDTIATPSIPWGGSDKATIIIGAMLPATGVQSGVFRGGGSPQVFGMVKPSNDKPYVNSGGTAIVTANSLSVATLPKVLTVQTDIAAPYLRLREDGVQVAQNLASQGTGGFGDGVLDIMSYGGGQFALGRVYGVIAINRTLTAPELAAAEKWMAGKMGVAL